MERNLDLTITLNKEEFEVCVSEPESGAYTKFQFPYSFDEHPEFDNAIGAEIYSWVSHWRDEQEENF